MASRHGSRDAGRARRVGGRHSSRGAAALASALRHARAFAAELLLPRACLACDAAIGAGEPGLVCRACMARLARLPAPQCPRCGHPNLRPECAWCSLLPPYVRAVRSVCWVPHGVAGTLLHRFKYDGWTGLAGPLGGAMARLPFPVDVIEERSALVPVPLAAVRLRERGYNQSALLAQEVARAWHVPVEELLARSRATRSQTRLTPDDRLRNVASAFDVTVPSAQLAGRHLVLVDDVVTTGATLHACAAALYASGARIISYVTFGRARAPGDAP